MVMEAPDGEWAVEELRPGIVLYVLPRWAHRSVNAECAGKTWSHSSSTPGTPATITARSKSADFASW